MSRWSPQRYRSDAPEGTDGAVLERAVAIGKAIVAANPDLPPLFTLNHLAYEAGVPYDTAHAFVARTDANAYRVFRIRKRPIGGADRRFRVIAVPSDHLMRLQRWIAQNLLKPVAPHYASTAFARGSKLYDAAKPHSKASWVVKVDVRNFFESINEIAVYRVFLGLGYQALMAFELTRLCTRLGPATSYNSHKRFKRSRTRASLPSYDQARMGHLPQGAPTSPMLANLAVRELDERLEALGNASGMTYTRYADDLTFSTRVNEWSREDASKLIGKVYSALGDYGLSPNIAKTQVVGPGSRRVVLGLLVDSAKPRLTRQFRALMRQHLYYLLDTKVGPAAHARARGFASVRGMKNHLFGLAAYASQIDSDYGRKCADELKLCLGQSRSCLIHLLEHHSL